MQKHFKKFDILYNVLPLDNSIFLIKVLFTRDDWEVCRLLL